MPQMFKRGNTWMNLEQLRKLEGKEEVEAPVEESEEPVEEEAVEDAKPAFVCPICGRETKSQWHLDKHVKSHEKDVPSEVVFEPEVPVETEPAVEESTTDKSLDKILE